MKRIYTPEELRLERAVKRVKQIKGFYQHLIAYIFVNLFLIALKYFQIEDGAVFYEFSTFSTAFFWGIGLLFHGLNVLGKNFFFDAKWEEKKINEYMNDQQKTKWE